MFSFVLCTGSTFLFDSMNINNDRLISTCSAVSQATSIPLNDMVEISLNTDSEQLKNQVPAPPEKEESWKQSHLQKMTSLESSKATTQPLNNRGEKSVISTGGILKNLMATSPAKDKNVKESESVKVITSGVSEAAIEPLNDKVKDSLFSPARSLKVAVPLSQKIKGYGKVRRFRKRSKSSKDVITSQPNIKSQEKEEIRKQSNILKMTSSESSKAHIQPLNNTVEKSVIAPVGTLKNLMGALKAKDKIIEESGNVKGISPNGANPASKPLYDKVKKSLFSPARPLKSSVLSSQPIKGYGKAPKFGKGNKYSKGVSCSQPFMKNEDRDNKSIGRQVSYSQPPSTYSFEAKSKKY